MSKMAGILVMILVLFSSALTRPMMARDTAIFMGKIEDLSGAPVLGAHIEMTHTATQETLKTVSGQQGEFEFYSLRMGAYILKSKANGFVEETLEVNVNNSPVMPVRVRMKTDQSRTGSGKIDDKMRASDSNSPVRSLAAVRLNQHLIEGIPAKDGNPLPTAILFVDPVAAGVEGVSVVLDDIDIELPPSSIERIYTNRNPFSAKYRRPGKGRVDATTRTGSADLLHSSVVLTFRNSALDARNGFAATRPYQERMLFDGAVGGPLYRDKATFYLESEYLRDNQSAVVNALTPSGPLEVNVSTPERRVLLYGRIDMRLNPVHSLTLRYNLKRDTLRNQRVGGVDLPERASNALDNAQELRFSEKAFLSPQFSNELRFGIKDKTKGVASITDQPAIIVLGAFSRGGGQIAQQQKENRVELEDFGTLTKGNHRLRFGVEVKRRSFQISDASNFGGTFTFSSLAAFTSQRPALFTMNVGDPRISFAQYEYTYFLEDEIKLRPNFNLLVGMHHALQSNLNDHDNLAPRLALSYAPGEGRTVFRAGAGIFYERQPSALVQQSMLLDGLRLRRVVISNPGFARPIDPSSPLHFSTPSVVRTASDLATPCLLQASVGMERKLGKNEFLAVEYTMFRGLHLYRMRDINAPLPQTGIRPNSDFLNISQFETSGTSRSHSLTVTIQGAVLGRFQFTSQYTLSRTLDDTSGLFSQPADNFNLRAERGRADYDRRHRFNLAGTVKLPGDFQLGAIASLSSGIPFNITTGFDNNHDSVINDRPLGVTRNTGRGPGFANVDVRLSKRLYWSNREVKGEGSSRYLEFRIDAFNVFNRTNPRNFIGTLSSPLFGLANSGLPARQLQLSAKMSF